MSSSARRKSFLSAYVRAIEPSATVAMHAATQELKAQGEQITSLCVGEPDYDPPAQVLAATIAAVQAVPAQTHYTGVTGRVDLREAIVADAARRTGVAYEAGNVVLANGAKQLLFQACLALLGPGDRCVVPTPYWPSHLAIVGMCGAEATLLPSSAEEGYALSPAKLRAVLAADAAIKLLILCNPSNPTGVVQPRSTLVEVATILDEHEAATGKKVWVIADEIYERLLYDGAELAHFGSISPSAYARTVHINGFSKSHAMTGYRLGYSCCPSTADGATLSKAIATIQGQVTSCPGSISQAAALAALAVPDDDDFWTTNVVEGLGRKRARCLERLGELEGEGLVTVGAVPCGAFYVLPVLKLGGDCATSLAFCVALLEREKVALVPGEAFGAPGTCRISYAASIGEVEAAIAGLGRLLRALHQ